MVAATGVRQCISMCMANNCPTVYLVAVINGIIGERERANLYFTILRRHAVTVNRSCPSRLAARQDLLSCKICEVILVSSETAGGRPCRAWSAPPSSSCLLGPCSRSLPRQAMERRRPLLHVSLTITLRQTVSTRSSCVIRCLPKHVAHVPKCTRPAFLCRVKGHTLTFCARTRLFTYTVSRACASIYRVICTTAGRVECCWW